MRAVAMIAICWDHWCPKGWPRVFPFEVFLFFFLVLTGYLITGALLRERDRHALDPSPWRLKALKNYHLRRGIRILAPYYAALAVAWIVWAPDLHSAPGWYLLHLSNIHMAFLHDWPPGTNHFWSLSIQQQFYVIWPCIIWWIPQRLLLPVVVAFSAIGPATRYAHEWFETWLIRPEVMTWTAFDYFGIGALLAVAVNQGLPLSSRKLRWLSITAFGVYGCIYGSHLLGGPTFGLRFLQQTFLAISLCGVIAAGTTGLPGAIGGFLRNPSVLRIGQVSYGIYLFHNVAPLVAGKLFWFLWNEPFTNGLGDVLRILIFGTITWALTMASWHFIEQPLQQKRSHWIKN